ncbi:hypothetical protein AADZ91_18360 [Colwelliaceae bacterium 6441]
MKLSNIIIGVLTITTLMAGWAAYNSSKANEKQEKDIIALGELNSQLNQELQIIKEQLSIFQQKSNTSKVLISSLNNEILELKKQRVVQEVVNTPLSKPKKDEVIDFIKAEEVITESDALLAFAKKIQSGESIADIESNMRKKFSEEEVDGNWAYEYENNIRDLVMSDENNNFDIQELSCKTSACEVKITATKDNAMVLGTMFSKAIGEKDWRDKSASVIFNHEIKDGAMSILIGRDKHSFN